MEINIKKERKFRDMTQEEFANFLGVDRKTIVGYESGNKIPKTKLKMFERILKNNIDSSNKENVDLDIKKIVKLLLEKQNDLLNSELFLDFLNDCNREIEYKKIEEDNELKRQQAKKAILEKLKKSK